MNIKVKDLYDLALGLKDLADKEVNIKIALKIQRNQKAVSEELVSTDKIRNKLIEKYKEKEFDNGDVKIKDSCIKKFNKEMQELMQQEINIELGHINLNDLDGITIKPRTISLLQLILVDSE